MNWIKNDHETLKVHSKDQERLIYESRVKNVDLGCWKGNVCSLKVTSLLMKKVYEAILYGLYPF